MSSDLAHALDVLDEAIRDVQALHHQTADTWEAVTTLEGRNDFTDQYAATLWRILGWSAGGQRRHQGGRVLEVLRGCVGR